MTALDLLMAGRFDEAIEAYKTELAIDPNDIGLIDGLSNSYQQSGNYTAAIPLMERVHQYQKGNPDHPGQHLSLAVAYWCLDDRERAIELANGLCASILDRSVTMAPDQAGGATFGLILHYMSNAAHDEKNYNFAIEFLKKLNGKYNKHPNLFHYPVQTVKQVLGEATFEDALVGATAQSDLNSAYRAAEKSLLAKGELGIALFHDGVLKRVNGNEAACGERMQQVNQLGHQTETVRWHLARHEVLTIT